jgi:quercetin dioxygenase-like cupin family protein
MIFHHMDVDTGAGGAEASAGVARQIAHGAAMTVALVAVKAGARIPAHAHPNEQISFVIAGVFDMTVGDETRRLAPGGLAIIPANAPHAGHAVADCAIVEVFTPRREDFAFAPPAVARKSA